MREFIEELKYNQNINFEKGLENRIDIDYVIERLEDIEKEENVSPYWKASKCEVETAIDDIYNDELYNDKETQEKLTNLTEEDINRLADYVDDDGDCWADVYNCARWYVLKEIGKEDE
jgi:hypothetical protein